METIGKEVRDSRPFPQNWPPGSGPMKTSVYGTLRIPKQAFIFNFLGQKWSGWGNFPTHCLESAFPPK